MVFIRYNYKQIAIKNKGTGVGCTQIFLAIQGWGLMQRNVKKFKGLLASPYL